MSLMQHAHRGWWKYKEQHSASAIHEMHMTLSCELLNVQNYHVVSWLTGGEGQFERER